ncbi:MAG: glucan biosynthesis protein [Hyphomicrobiaceae bacterium]|nr:glucan biosynthesis protein [Hyphomicrobiaceae bacterium]
MVESMDRRDFLSSVLALTGLAVTNPGMFDGIISAAQAQGANDAQPFSRTQLLLDARKLAQTGFVEPRLKMPEPYAEMSYDQYRSIRPKGDRALWRGEGRGFQFEFLHTGFLFKQPVQMFVIEDGKARPLGFDRDNFEYGPTIPAPEPGVDLGYSGFRVRSPINAADVWDEFAVFQGATYFRAVGKGQAYGLSARGLAIATGDPRGEEFPNFRAFWIERPGQNATACVVYALLDSPSVTGVYRFTLRPGEPTTVDVELTLFPRVELSHVGLGPLTSMFFFDATNRTRVDDYRSAVHDSEGVAMWTGRGEWIWRPLANPRTLQISGFIDQNPRGFGLVQRSRDFRDYGDLNARYDLRPTAWVEPVGDWGQGAVELIEIPTEQDIHDNIVAYWRPREPMKVGQEFSATYRLHWTNRIPNYPDQIAKVTDTRAGLGTREGFRRYMIDFNGPNLPPVDQLKLDASTSAGRLINTSLRQNSASGGVRVIFELDVRDIQLAELRVLLTANGQSVSETWLYRWTT